MAQAHSAGGAQAQADYQRSRRCTLTEPTEVDLARWAKWEDLRARKEVVRRERAAATTKADVLAVTRKETILEAEEEALHIEGVKEVLHKDMDTEPQWFWLSFRDVDTNTNLGVAIVEGGGVVEAALNAKLAKCNPGGEVMAYPLENVPDEKYRYRLLSEQELKDAGLTA